MIHSFSSDDDKALADVAMIRFDALRAQLLNLQSQLYQESVRTLNMVGCDGEQMSDAFKTLGNGISDALADAQAECKLIRAELGIEPHKNPVQIDVIKSQPPSVPRVATE